MSPDEIYAEVSRYGYTEVDGDQIDQLPYGWLEERGWSLAHKAGTSTYVVYRSRQARAPVGESQFWRDLVQVSPLFPNEPAEAIRWSMLQTPFSRDSVASRVLDEAERRVDANSYNRPPRGWPTFEGAPFVVDGTLRQDELWGFNRDGVVRVENLAEPPNQTATGAMMEAAREREVQAQVRQLREWADRQDRRRLDQMAWGDGDGSAPVYTGDIERPDHYRVRPGICACGFHTVFTEDMRAHIDDDLIEVNGVPKRWRRCERCQASALCREVVVAAPSRVPGWAATFDPNRLPGSGSLETMRVYRCDNCTRGL